MKSSFWIFVSIVTRPFTWLLVPFLIGTSVFLAGVLTDKYETLEPEILQGRHIRTQLELFLLAQSGDPQTVQIAWGDIAQQQSLKVVPRIEPGGTRHIGIAEHAAVDNFLATLAFPENVEALDTGSWCIRQSTLNTLGKIKSLKRLGFLITFNSDKLDLSPLQNLQQLEVLDLGLFSSYSTSLAPLADLPNLHTLRIGAHQMMTAERMEEVARLPHLKTLYLPNVNNTDRVIDAITPLTGSSSLQQVLMAITMEEPAKLAAVRAAIPNATVQASKFLPARGYAFAAAIWMTMMTAGLAIHFVSMLASPMSELIPRYKLVHQRVIWSIVFVVLLLFTAMVCRFGADPIIVLGVLSLCMVTTIRDSFDGHLAIGENRGLQRLRALVPLGALAASVLICFTQPMWVESFLLGTPLIVSIGLLALTGFVFVRTYRGMDRFCRERIERGKPLMLSMFDIQRATVDLTQNRAAGGAESTPDSPSEHADRMTMAMGLIALVVVLVSRIEFVTENTDWFPRIAAMISFFIAAWSVFVVGAKWWQRMPYLAGMITRPPERKQQVDNTFVGVARDFTHFGPIALANIVLMTNTVVYAPDDFLLRLVVSVLLVASVLAICYAGMMWTLVIRSVIGVIVLCLLTYLGVGILATIAIVAGTDVPPTSLATWRVLLVIAFLMAAAVFAAMAARRYFARLEWGKFA